MSILLYVILLLDIHQQGNEIEGHWLRVSERESTCTEEVFFKNNGEFSIINECFDVDEIEEVATGKYVTDGPVIYLNGLMFSSGVSDYYTREYTRLEWEIHSDTLTLTVYRFVPEERTFIRY